MKILSRVAVSLVAVAALATTPAMTASASTVTAATSASAASAASASKPTCNGKSTQVKYVIFPLTYWIWSRNGSSNRWTGQLWTYQPKVGYINVNTAYYNC